MPITREWLSWDEPCLPQAAAWLIDHHARGGECDLREILCVLPGARAGRLLLAELLKVCAKRDVRLVPPRVLTPGAMVDALLAQAGEPIPIASAFESHLAWIAALREADPTAIAPLLPQPPSGDDLAAWSDLARTLTGLHETLAGELKDFIAVAETAERMSMPGEGERWRAMAGIAGLQRQMLRKTGLTDHHEARRVLIERAIALAARGEMHRREIALIGVSDLNALQKAALRLTSVCGVALVHAPASEADAFDELGTVRTEAWTNRHIAIDDDCITVVERPPQQAQAALRFLAELGDGHASPHVTIGLGDAALLGDLQSAGQWAGVSIHNPSGVALQRSAPFRLLEAACEWIKDRRFEHLASLLRHPEVERWVMRTAKVVLEPNEASAEEESQKADVASGQIEWLTLLDEYFSTHLQARLDGGWLGSESTRAKLKAVHVAVCALLAPLMSNEGQPRPLQEWCQPMLDVLANAYAIETDAGGEPVKREVAAALPSIDAALALRDALAEIASASPQLQPSMTAARAVRLLLDHIGGNELALDREPGSIEALGWLELHLDTAPALVIVGCNDGAVPEAIIGHAFLPDSLRRALGLMNNARRFARDAYLLQAIVKSRKPLRLIVGRRSAQGDPLSPSRLLLACDDEKLASRIIEFAEDRSEEPSATPLGLPRIRAGAASRFTIPALKPLAAPSSMRVTDFRSYLQCPYRYALGRLIGLEAFDDSLAELDPLGFGSLVHEVLATLGEDASVAASDDAAVVFAHLHDRLGEIVKRDFGSSPLPALRLQIAHIEQRLRSFAHAQAVMTREGWRIAHCEIGFNGEVALDIPGEAPMPLRGRIDRIDFNEREGRWRVIDYKTGESAKSPLKAHHDRNKLPDDPAQLEWVDLQLPLYQLLVTRGPLRLPADQIELGYIVLPKQTGGVEWLRAEWSAEHLAHGLDRAREVVRDIRRGKYGVDDMSDDIDAEFDSFARICQSAAFKTDINGDDEGEGGS